MSNTDRIRFSHMKTVVDRIKDWVDELYPITYNNSSKWFKWYPTMAKASAVVDIEPNDVNITTDTNFGANVGNSAIIMNGSQILMRPNASGDQFTINKNTGNVVMNSNPILVGVDYDNEDIWGLTIDNEKVLVKAVDAVNVKVGTSELSLKDADLVFTDSGNPNCSLIMGGVTPAIDANHPHTIYSASGDGVGHIETTSGSKSVTHSTTGGYVQVGTIKLSAGSWLISFGVSTEANLKDNEYVKVRLTTGIGSTSAIYGGYHSSHTGAATRMGISALGEYRVPDGETKELPLQVSLGASDISVGYKITAVKIR